MSADENSYTDFEEEDNSYEDDFESDVDASTTAWACSVLYAGLMLTCRPQPHVRAGRHSGAPGRTNVKATKADNVAPSVPFSIPTWDASQFAASKPASSASPARVGQQSRRDVSSLLDLPTWTAEDFARSSPAARDSVDSIPPPPPAERQPAAAPSPPAAQSSRVPQVAASPAASVPPRVASHVAPSSVGSPQRRVQHRSSHGSFRGARPRSHAGVGSNALPELARSRESHIAVESDAFTTRLVRNGSGQAPRAPREEAASLPDDAPSGAGASDALPLAYSHDGALYESMLRAGGTPTSQWHPNATELAAALAKGRSSGTKRAAPPPQAVAAQVLPALSHDSSVASRAVGKWSEVLEWYATACRRGLGRMKPDDSSARQLYVWRGCSCCAVIDGRCIRSESGRQRQVENEQILQLLIVALQRRALDKERESRALLLRASRSKIRSSKGSAGRS